MSKKIKHSLSTVRDVLAIALLAFAPGWAFAQDAAPTPSDTAAPVDAAPAADASVPPPPPADAAATPDLSTPTAAAPVSADAVPTNTDPLYADGPYAALLGRFVRFDGDNALDYGFGANVAVGLRRGPVAFEINGNYTAAKHSSNLFGGTVDTLIFPFQSLPGLFAIVGIGDLYVDKYPGIGKTTFNVAVVDGGVGYLLPLKFGSYQFGLRMQALYEYGKRLKREQDQPPPTIDLPIASNYHDIIANIGLQFPFGKVETPVPAPQTPVAVVEAPPPPPPPPKPECRKPAPGEKVTLDGCGTGDVIVLNGVNFDFNKATLTPNAKTILDQVSEELVSHPDIKVELAGHTDGKGSAPYNQKLSQKRAESVRKYFIDHGVTGDRMTAVGYGKTQPIDTNDTDEGRAHNRRVELRITASAGEVAQPVVVPTGSADGPTTPTPP